MAAGRHIWNFTYSRDGTRWSMNFWAYDEAEAEGKFNRWWAKQYPYEVPHEVNVEFWYQDEN